MGRCALLIVSVLVGCRTGAGALERLDPASVATGEAGAASAPPAAVPVEGASAPRDADGASGADRGAAEGCGAEAVTLDEIHSGRVRSGVALAVSDLVATSQKFLVSEAKSGSCLWGAFAAGSRRTGAGSGLLLVSFGAKHADGEACVPGTDALADVTPGDALRVEGTLRQYVSADCDGVAPEPQLRVDAACPARRLGRTDPPAPVVVNRALATRLAEGTDRQLLRDWSGALIALDGVTAVRDADDGDAVFPFGVIRLVETPLEVHSRLYYFDLSEGGPRSATKTPRFGYPSRFERITGLVSLDYCRWSLAPRDRCADLAPPSDDCAADLG
jgi:hypothetical protein